jgi:hypothetical protein
VAENSNEKNDSNSTEPANNQESESTDPIQQTSLKKDINEELQKIKDSLERRMDKQEEQMSEIIQVIKVMNEDFEKRMIHVVLAALSKEKEKVQELTHGCVYQASEAPLADEEGNLPYGGKVQLGGPLDRLHHVEVTVQQMANALDMIAEHLIQKDPSAKKLFITDDESETSTLIESPLPNTQAEHAKNTKTIIVIDNDTQMTMKEQSGTKRMHSTDSPIKHGQGPDPETQSPNRSPPPKKRREINQPSASPDDNDREQGRS